MPLPEAIEIVPAAGPIGAEVTVPGSKSITNRALILAALAQGPVDIRGALWSEDTQIMVECLQKLGFQLEISPDPSEPSNRNILVTGCAGKLPPGGTQASPLELFVGNAGTAARFLTAFLCLGDGYYRLSGIPRMHERPQAALFQSLRELGYTLISENDRLPVIIVGSGPRHALCQVSIDESSQFASALILSAPKGRWKVKVSGHNSEESPYVRLTDLLVATFPHLGGTFEVEADASSASYFLGLDSLLHGAPDPWSPRNLKEAEKLLESPAIKIVNRGASDWQIDGQFWRYAQGGWELVLQNWIFKNQKPVAPQERCISRSKDLGDSIMTAIVLAPLWKEPTHFTELGRLRLQECERVKALRTELTRCGAHVLEHGDTLTVYPAQLHGAEIDTYNDHRMAMCFSMLGAKVPGMIIRNPSCVKKTFPNWFQKLGAAAPGGLGLEILDARTHVKLEPAQLLAD